MANPFEKLIYIIKFMTISSVLLDYANRKSLNDDQIEYLEKALIASIQKVKFTGVRPQIADDIVCDAALIARNSLEISCMASILDILRPIEGQSTRKKRVFNTLCNSRLIITD